MRRKCRLIYVPPSLAAKKKKSLPAKNYREANKVINVFQAGNVGTSNPLAARSEYLPHVISS